MKHYTESEWLAFKHHEIKKPEADIMEDHLLECDPCLNLFLNLTGELEAARANASIPADFSRNTMAIINHSNISQPVTVRSRDKIKRLFFYYVAASVVTLILVGGGFFETVVGNSRLIAANSTLTAETPNSIIFTWPTRLMETSSSWTQLIPQKSKNIKEVLWW